MGPQRVGRTEAGSVASSYSLRATVVITTATTAKGSLPVGLMRSVCRHPALRGPPSSTAHSCLAMVRMRVLGALAAERPSCCPLTAPPPCPAQCGQKL